MSRFEREYALGLGQLTFGKIVKNAAKEDFLFFWLFPLLFECANMTMFENVLVSSVLFALVHGLRSGFIKNGSRFQYFYESAYWIHKFPYVFVLGMVMWNLAQWTNIVIECIFHILWNTYWISKIQEKQNLGGWIHDMAEITKTKGNQKDPTPEEQEFERQWWSELNQGVHKLFSKSSW